MIKCNVTVRGAVSRAATNRDGKASFAVKTVIPGNKTVEIFVTYEDADICNTIAVGNRVEMTGDLAFRKKGDALYLNFYASTITATEAADTIEGNLEFKGTVGKQIDMKTDKKGRKFLVFSAYSADKVGDNFEYMWVRFVRFSEEREAFLQPKAKIQASGKLEISSYQDRINLSCRLEQLTERQPLPFHSDNSDLPF